MRNPLHFSSTLLVKHAGQSPILNIPAYSAPAEQAPAISDDQIARLLQNIQTYPIAQQKQILDNINKDYSSSQRRGGILGRFFGDIGNTIGRMWDGTQDALGQVSGGLWGGSGFDTQDASRDRAQVVLQNAAQNPEMYKRLTERLNVPAPTAPAPVSPPTPPAPAPTATTPPPPAAPVAPPAATPTAPAPAATTPTAPVVPASPNATATINKAVTGGFLPNAGAPTPRPTPLVSAPTSSPTPAPAPAPVAPTAAVAPARKEGLIEGVPASQWIAQNKARQAQEALNYKSNPTQTTPALVSAPAPTAPTPASTYDPNYRPKLKGINTFKVNPQQMRRGILG
jgi:hypothetical protein